MLCRPTFVTISIVVNELIEKCRLTLAFFEAAIIFSVVRLHSYYGG